MTFGKISQRFGCIAIKFGGDINDAQWMNPNDFGGPLLFQLVPPAKVFTHPVSQYQLGGLAQTFHGPQTMYSSDYDQIPTNFICVGLYCKSSNPIF